MTAPCMSERSDAVGRLMLLPRSIEATLHVQVARASLEVALDAELEEDLARLGVLLDCIRISRA